MNTNSANLTPAMLADAARKIGIAPPSSPAAKLGIWLADEMPPLVAAHIREVTEHGGTSVSCYHDVAFDCVALQWGCSSCGKRIRQTMTAEWAAQCLRDYGLREAQEIIHGTLIEALVEWVRREPCFEQRSEAIMAEWLTHRLAKGPVHHEELAREAADARLCSPKDAYATLAKLGFRAAADGTIALPGQHPYRVR